MSDKPAGWRVVEATSGDLHVMPIDDLRAHVAEAGCWCDPRQDHENGCVIIHDALDLRQEREHRNKSDKRRIT